MILLLLLSLCATDCRVHRAYELRDDGSINIRIGCMYKLDDTGGAVGSCLQPSHWLPCTVVEKCDTTWTVRYRLEQTSDGTRARCDSFPIIRCHPDTLVDSGVVTLYHAIQKPVSDDGITMRYRPAPPQPPDSTELADLREMLREWRVEKCMASAYRHWGRGWIFPDEEKRIVDSCECVYGGRK